MVQLYANPYISHGIHEYFVIATDGFKKCVYIPWDYCMKNCYIISDSISVRREIDGLSLLESSYIGHSAARNTPEDLFDFPYRLI